MTEVEQLKKRVKDIERVATRQANALQAYLVGVHSKKLDSSIAVELYIANHDACKVLGIPIKTAVKQ